ncbi:hypothetical protein HDV03_000998 [Kappamyces sp. JEL0829]|nr:hypothetical protein HDV03_000998 [Kappamyces sp. JEL0829]
MSVYATEKGTLKEYLWCLFLAVPWIGIQALWSSEFGTADDTLKALGFAPAIAKLAWIWGPITGFFTAPIVGAYSDVSTSKYGRRRPFMVGGLVLFTLSSLLYCFAFKFGSFGPVAGYLGVVFMDITINVIQTPVRAFASDMVPVHMQNTVQLMAVACQGVGGMIGMLIMKELYGSIATLPSLVLTVVGLNVVCTGIVCVVAKEKSFKGIEAASVAAPFASILNNLFRVDFKLGIVFACEFFSWASLFSFWPRASNWVQEDVYHGDALAPSSTAAGMLYLEGTAAVNQASYWQLAVQIVLGAALGLLLMRRAGISVRFLWALGLFIGSVALILTSFVFTKEYALLMIALTGVMMTAINSFPFALVGAYNRSNDRLDTGVQFGIMNIFICLAQFFMQVLVASIPSFTTALLISGVLGLCACACAIFAVDRIPEPPAKTPLV